MFACVVATYAATLGSLIEVVNRFGSFFYGSILGVFLLAMIPRVRALGAFVGLLCGMACRRRCRVRRAERQLPLAQRDRRGDGGCRRIGAQPWWRATCCSACRDGAIKPARRFTAASPR